MKNSLFKSVVCVSLSVIAAAALLTGCAVSDGSDKNGDTAAVTTEYQVKDTDYSFDKKYYAKIIPPKEKGGDRIIGICLTENDEVTVRITPRNKAFTKIVWDENKYRIILENGNSGSESEAYSYDGQRWVRSDY